VNNDSRELRCTRESRLFNVVVQGPRDHGERTRAASGPREARRGTGPRTATLETRGAVDSRARLAAQGHRPSTVNHACCWPHRGTHGLAGENGGVIFSFFLFFYSYSDLYTRKSYKLSECIPRQHVKQKINTF
jgi:hypothetical protein